MPREAEGTFIASDIFKLTEKLEAQIFLILVHDVIEHIDDKAGFMKGLKRYLAPGGVVFIAFPAWQMPFGGHQQIAHSKVVSHFPFLHSSAFSAHKGVLAAAGENEPTIRELMNIKHTRCPIEKFQAALYATGYRVVDRQLDFINPHYETKFGLSPVSFMARFPSCHTCVISSVQVVSICAARKRVQYRLSKCHSNLCVARVFGVGSGVTGNIALSGFGRHARR